MGRGDDTFKSAPAHGPAFDFSVGTPALVDQAVQAAEEAFWTFGYTTREERAVFLETIADEIDARGDAVTEIGTSETGLPDARLVGRAWPHHGSVAPLCQPHSRRGLP